LSLRPILEATAKANTGFTPNLIEEAPMSKQALIVVDIQNDYFPQGKWPMNR
jgi:hypothetical protein